MNLALKNLTAAHSQLPRTSSAFDLTIQGQKNTPFGNFFSNVRRSPFENTEQKISLFAVCAVEKALRLL